MQKRNALPGKALSGIYHWARQSMAIWRQEDAGWWPGASHECQNRLTNPDVQQMNSIPGSTGSVCPFPARSYSQSAFNLDQHHLFARFSRLLCHFVNVSHPDHPSRQSPSLFSLFNWIGSVWSLFPTPYGPVKIHKKRGLNPIQVWSLFPTR